MLDYTIIRKKVEESNEDCILWVCAYSQGSALSNADRHVKPTKISARMGFKRRSDILELQFVSFNKKNELTSKLIPLHGTARHNDTLHCFYDEQECINKYNTLVFDAIKKFEQEKENVAKQIDAKIEELKRRFVNSDYVMEVLSRN